jgi:hypothetical protein
MNELEVSYSERWKKVMEVVSKGVEIDKVPGCVSPLFGFLYLGALMLSVNIKPNAIVIVSCDQ